MTMTNKRDKMNEDAGYGVDSRYTTSKERVDDAVALMQARLERMKNLSKEEILRAKLLQLKLKMENYLKGEINEQENHFAYFLASYVDALYAKRSEFAMDINVTPVFLSQVINRHREPKEEFILKLMLHAEKAFKGVSHFQKKTWYQVYFHEKLNETMANQDKWGPEIEKQVKLTESVLG